VSRHAVDHDVNANDAVCYESIDAETGGGPGAMGLVDSEAPTKKVTAPNSAAPSSPVSPGSVVVCACCVLVGSLGWLEAGLDDGAAPQPVAKHDR
jgi:hypothetical protein